MSMRHRVAAIGSMRERIPAVVTETTREITLVVVAARTEAMRGKTLVVVAGTKMIDKKGIKSIYYEIS